MLRFLYKNFFGSITIDSVNHNLVTLLQLHLAAIYSILLSSILGFGVAMGINFMYIQYVTWRLQVSTNDSPV